MAHCPPRFRAGKVLIENGNPLLGNGTAGSACVSSRLLPLQILKGAEVPKVPECPNSLANLLQILWRMKFDQSVLPKDTIGKWSAARGFEPPTPWSRNVNRCAISLIPIVWCCGVVHRFSGYLASLDPRLDPTFNPTESTVHSSICVLKIVLCSQRPRRRARPSLLSGTVSDQ